MARAKEAMCMVVSWRTQRHAGSEHCPPDGGILCEAQDAAEQLFSHSSRWHMLDVAFMKAAPQSQLIHNLVVLSLLGTTGGTSTIDIASNYAFYHVQR